MDTYLLRNIAYSAAAGVWQRGNGKGKKPEPIPLPGEKRREKSKTARGEDVAERLKNLGLLPAVAGQQPPSADELRREAEDAFLAREQRLATET